MDPTATAGLLAIDVGNSRLKLAWYASPKSSAPTTAASVMGNAVVGASPSAQTKPTEHAQAINSPNSPVPDDRLDLEGGTGEQPLPEELLIGWLKQFPLAAARCLIASVQRVKLQRLLNLMNREAFTNPKHPPHVLAVDDLPISVHVDCPGQVGIDRLLNGVVANRLRNPQKAAIIVSMGSAITVDRVAPDGAFEGGAILPGLSLAAAALHEGTDLLPQIIPRDIPALPPAIGKNTREAIEGGLFWGTLGAIGELLRQQGRGELAACDIFVTGGDAIQLVDHLQQKNGYVQYQEQMVLHGIWLVAQDWL